MNHSKLDELNACREAVDWCSDFGTLQEAWDKCERGDWMLWYLGQTCGATETDSHRTMTACKAACARLVLHIWEAKYPDDARPKLAIEAAEKYSRGEITASASAASAAAADAAAADAADDAASAASAAYSAAASASAAYSAAWAAAGDAAWDAAWAAAGDAARFAMLKQCAEEIRKIVPTI